MAASNGTSPPTPTGQDIALAVFYGSCCLVGLPINILTFVRLRRVFARNDSRVLLLRLHLNLSDLCVLLFYAFGRFCWQLTYAWRGGELLCKLMRFLESLSFAASSYVLVCIALDRLITLRRPLKAVVAMPKWVPRMLGLAWAAATVVSLPQLFMWRLYRPFTTWHQCINVLVIEQFASSPPNDTFVATTLKLKLYSAYHILCVFWLPLLVMLPSYAIILFLIFNAEAKLTRTKPGRLRAVFLQCPSGNIDNSAVTLTPEVAASPAVSRRHSADEGIRRLTGHGSIRRARLRATGITLALVAVYIACWLPYNSLQICYVVAPALFQRLEERYHMLHAFVILNSVVNPFVYGNLLSRQRRRRPGPAASQPRRTPTAMLSTTDLMTMKVLPRRGRLSATTLASGMSPSPRRHAQTTTLATTPLSQRKVTVTFSQFSDKTASNRRYGTVDPVSQL